MPAKGDDVAEKIESQVRDAISKMVSDMRSSIEDVREAVVQQLQAAMQSVQADANALSIKSQLQQILSGGAGQAVAAAAPPPAADAARIKQAIQNVERGTSQIDILNALLDQALHFGSRAALLILKGDVFTGWKGTGFSAHGGSDESIKRFSASAASVPELDRLLRQEQVVAWNGASVASRLGASAPQRAVMIPMVIKDKVAAVMYVDAADPGKLNQNALELLVFTTGLLIDTMPFRKKVPSPSMSRQEADVTVMVEEPFAEATVALPPQPPRPAAPPPRPAAPPPTPPRPAPSAPPPRPARQFEIESEASAARRPAAAADSFATTAIPAMPQVPPPQPPRPAPAPSGSTDLGERASTQYIPPAGVKGGARFGGAQTDESKKHDEAKRFARLLVSEIKLYNESKVDQGRKHKDIYERLKDDIDRSRQMYDERVPDSVRKASNYFYDELVRILADGDPDALGL